MSAINNLINHARANGGIFTTEEARALGLPKTTLYRRVDDGIFVKVSEGVLALPGTATKADVMLRVASRQLGAVVSHQSAASALGMSPIGRHQPSVTVTHRGSNRLEGVVVHQSTDLLPQHVQLINGLDTTTPERTVIDLAQVLRPSRLERVVDNGLAAGLIDFNALEAMHAALSRRGKPGVRTLRLIIEKRSGKTAISTSELEAELLALIERSGLPTPVREFQAPWLKRIEGRVDVAYINEQVVVEADGRRWHTLFDAFEVDRRRDNAAQLAGWIVLRFTWRMIKDDPIGVASTIRDVLERR